MLHALHGEKLKLGEARVEARQAALALGIADDEIYGGGAPHANGATPPRAADAGAGGWADGRAGGRTDGRADGWHVDGFDPNRTIWPHAAQPIYSAGGGGYPEPPVYGHRSECSSQPLQSCLCSSLKLPTCEPPGFGSTSPRPHPCSTASSDWASDYKPPGRRGNVAGPGPGSYEVQRRSDFPDLSPETRSPTRSPTRLRPSIFASIAGGGGSPRLDRGGAAGSGGAQPWAREQPAEQPRRGRVWRLHQLEFWLEGACRVPQPDARKYAATLVDFGVAEPRDVRELLGHDFASLGFKALHTRHVMREAARFGDPRVLNGTCS